MSTSVVIAIVVALLAIAATVWAFSKKQKKKRQVVLIGRKGVGKTRLFLALARKHSPSQRTIPSFDVKKEKISSGVVLVDTPGANSFESMSLLEDLSSDDIVLYIFNKSAYEVPEKLETRARISKIYTGSGELHACTNYVKMDETVHEEHVEELLHQILR
ncbi:hypothetical protein NEMIN01_1659 [Nematocida minor]|uniref:uncharacterized protein n=1 Tax=Nematocida minor TaxID=1912983 RepID=UPI00221FE440|nr:uncharacterized protein NEMIN01_1659 [Nematocida minor]KAI5191768.1 hypothetical protein NEMIN01_1659 [Nematocida minor]